MRFLQQVQDYTKNAGKPPRFLARCCCHHGCCSATDVCHCESGLSDEHTTVTNLVAESAAGEQSSSGSGVILASVAVCFTPYTLSLLIQSHQHCSVALPRGSNHET